MRTLFYVCLLMSAGYLLLLAPGQDVLAVQQPTGSIPTVTGTVEGPYIVVTNPEGFIRVRTGPSTYMYPEVGILVQGETAPALGRSPQGEWIMIAYPGVPSGVGWVYAPWVSLFDSPGELPIVEPPPTATPRITPTIDPTLAAAYQVPLTPTRLPTFTPPAPLEIPTFEAGGGLRIGLPIGFIILGLAFIGIFGEIITFLRGRK